ncbi:MAG: hypothetical protein ACI4DU_07025 [Lachnospiraceae bacterium]
MICQNCGVENAANTGYCSNCNNPMPQVQNGTMPADGQQMQYSNPIAADSVTMQNQPTTYQQPQNNMQYQQPMVAPVNVNVQTQVIPPEYKPLGMWAYFGFELLFAIPIVGVILLIVFACGGTSNINLKNFARSYFCGLLIGLVITIVVVIIMAATGGIAVLMSDLNF